MDTKELIQLEFGMYHIESIGVMEITLATAFSLIEARGDALEILQAFPPTTDLTVHITETTDAVSATSKKKDPKKESWNRSEVRELEKLCNKMLGDPP